jgi:hypothetical protein
VTQKKVQEYLYELDKKRAAGNRKRRRMQD